MSKKFFAIATIIASALALLLPMTFALAACQQGATTICNPLGVDNIPDLIGSIMKILIGLLGVASVLMVVIAGFRMVISGGNSEAVEKARSQLTWAVGGLAIAALAYSIISIVSNLLANVGK